MKIAYILPKKLHKKIAATRAALFDLNMHQIVCRLGLHIRPHWGSLQRSPNALAVFRGLLLREGKGRAEEGTGREGRVGEGRGGAPMTLWHGAPNVLIRPWLKCVTIIIYSRNFDQCHVTNITKTTVIVNNNNHLFLNRLSTV